MRESTRAHESELAFLVRVFSGAAQIVACINFPLSTSHAAPPSVTSMQSSCGFYRGGKQPSEEDSLFVSMILRTRCCTLILVLYDSLPQTHDHAPNQSSTISN